MDYIYDGELELDYAEPVAKEIKKRMICPVHKRKVLLTCDYDNEGVNAYLTRYCCREHAQRVADALKETELFNRIEIKD